MGDFVVYSAKVSMCLMMFYVFYKLLLSRSTLHSFNRFMLLALVAVSLLLPFVHVGAGKTVVYGALSVGQLLATAMVVEPRQPEFHLSAISIGVLIYIIGVVGFFINMLVSYFGIHRMMKKAGTVVYEDGVRIFVMDDDVAPFSWFRNIVISSADYHAHREAIIAHEKAHVQKWHSMDVLLCNLLTVVQWFNPAAWLMKAELQDVHEYEADEAVLHCGINATDYQLLLVRKAVGDRLFAIANNLNKDSLKKRIAMMKTKRTNRWASMKALVVLPLAAVAVVAFATPEMAEVENKVVGESQQLLQAVNLQVAGEAEALAASAVDTETPMPGMAVAEAKPETASADTVKSGKAYDVVEVMPEFPGGVQAMMDYLIKNVSYSKEMIDNDIQGRVVVQFVVTKTGDIADAKVVRPVHPLLDAEALRVVNSMPKWTPGKQKGECVSVSYSLPITFKLSPKENVQKEKEVAPSDEKAGQAAAANSLDNALYVVDGQAVVDKSILKEINPDDIESITVLKKEDALRPYGEKGKHGVILIKMKKK